MATSMNEIMFQIHDKIKSNPDILKLLWYMDNETNPLEQPDLGIADTLKVIKNNIYTRKKVPADKDIGMQTYISMVYGQKIYHDNRNQYFNGNTFNLYVFCHNEFDTNEVIGSRVCEIERLIAEMFENGEIGSTGRTRVSRSIDRDVNGTDYSGRQIEIVFSDFNGDGNGH